MNIKHLPNWKKSAKQRSIELFHSPHFNWSFGQKAPVFIGGVHGDEPEGVRLAEELLKWLSAQDHSQLLTPWVVIPCLNVDGYAENSRTNANGVDLNRNYPSKNWVKTDKIDRYYSGPTPGSEPETQAIMELISQIHPGIVMHFHSWHPCVVATGQPAVPFARHLSHSSGYDLKEHIGYDTPGSLSQYGWHDHQIPIICTEEQEHSNLDHTWKNFGPGLIEIITNYSKIIS